MRHLALLLSLAFAGCISGDQVSGALTDYCVNTSPKNACTDDAECCPGYTCNAGGLCALSASCLVTDGGRVDAGSACGCAADCASGTCSSSAVCQ